jgi:DNA-binding protein Fis
MKDTRETKETEGCDCTIEDVLKKNLQKHLSKMKHVDNGNLYETVIHLVEDPLIRMVLSESKGNQIKASEMLGLNRNTLRKKIKEFRIKVK